MYCHGTPLIVAAQKSQLSAVRRLLRLKPNVNARTSRTGETALHKAAFEGNPEVVTALLDAGADPAVTDNDDETPLQYAERRDFYDVAGLLEAAAVAKGAT